MTPSVATLLATWFGAGRSPVAPGTTGSLAALPFAYAIHLGIGSGALMIASLCALVLGVWVSNIHIRTHATGKDPKEIVIDEVAGQWLVLAFMPPTLAGYALGFVLFRLFDILKPWPVSWIDERVEGGLGVMLDDIAAAIMGIALYLCVEAALPEHVTALLI